MCYRGRMTQTHVPVTPTDEHYAYAETIGISREDIDTVAEVITLTPIFPVAEVRFEGLDFGEGQIRVAREYDTAISDKYPGKSSLRLYTESLNVTLLVDREELIRQLSVEVPYVPPATASY